MRIKIQSESDIITNSSSEVFIKYDTKSVDTFKEKFQKLIKLLGSNVDIDDAIEIIPVFDDEDEAISEWKENNHTDREPSKQELYDYVFKETDHSFRIKEKSFPFIYDLEIRAKDPKYAELVNIMQYFTEPFESEELYC